MMRSWLKKDLNRLTETKILRAVGKPLARIHLLQASEQVPAGICEDIRTIAFSSRYGAQQSIP